MMIRILHSVSNMDRAGVETMIMNFYRRFDRERIQFDFLQNKKKPGDYDEEIRSMGGRIFVSPGYMSYKKYMGYMTEVFKTYPEYKILHAQNGPLMVYALKAAQINNIPVRIAHSHSTSIPHDFKFGLKLFVKPMVKRLATDYWACSNAAGEFLFTKKHWNSGNELIHNAIEVNRFEFNEIPRARIREQYGLGDKLVVGNVCRLEWQKNHKKLINIFNVLHKLEPASHLVIIGTGSFEEKLKKQVAELGLSDAVTFTGMQTNVFEWFSVFDVFVLSSFFEGLPVVGIEAQAADLGCVFTDTITPEVKVTDNVRFMGLKDNDEEWARAILSARKPARGSRYSDLKKAGYDIETEAKRLESLYIDMYERAAGAGSVRVSDSGASDARISV